MLQNLDYSALPPRKTGEDLFRWQCDQLANYLLLKDKRHALPTTTYLVKEVSNNIKWLNRGEMIAGSFAARYVCLLLRIDLITSEDVDIFFKSKEDAITFNDINGMYNVCGWDGEVCSVSKHDGVTYNLIYGIEFESPQELISSFDIRAVSIAVDPNKKEIIAVDGAIQDLADKTLVFNPAPRATSVKRLIKYTQKEFKIEAYQRLFFAELLRSDIYSSDIELTTGYMK